MAPELHDSKINKTYDGTAVDVFACGSILFLLKFARFAWNTSVDDFYQRLHRNPAKALKKRGLTAEKDFLDLFISLTYENPAKRLTLAQVRAHPWMKGDIAKIEEVRSHYYSLVPGSKKCLTKEHFKAMQAARASCLAQNKIHRSSGRGEDLVSWMKDAQFNTLSYKEFKGN